jgi:hypothetical protein
MSTHQGIKEGAGENCIILNYIISTAGQLVRIVKGKKARWTGHLARILRIYVLIMV